MNNFKFAELLSTKFELERSLHQLQSEQANGILIELQLQIAEQGSHLAILHLQQARIELASDRSML